MFPVQSLQLASSRISEINDNLPMYKRVAKVLVSDAPMPLANGIKVQRQKLKRLVENGSWKCRTLNAVLEQMSGGGGGTGTEGEIQNPRFLQIKEEVRKIFSDVLILPQEEIGDRAHFVIDLGGDSLSVIGVIAQLEEKYNIEITDEDFAKAVNVYEIAELIYKNTALCEAGEGSAAVRRIVRFEEMPAAKKFQAKKEQYMLEGAQFIDLETAAGGKAMVNFGSDGLPWPIQKLRGDKSRAQSCKEIWNRPGRRSQAGRTRNLSQSGAADSAI